MAIYAMLGGGIFGEISLIAAASAVWLRLAGRRIWRKLRAHFGLTTGSNRRQETHRHAQRFKLVVRVAFIHFRAYVAGELHADFL